MENSTNLIDKKPLVSVIVPIYNTEQYLNQCIESILSQDYPYFELLLVDDGSIDDCGKICESWASKDKRISVFHIENSGQSMARNYGLDHMHGDLITFIDSDDYISSDYLSYLLALFSADSSCAFTSCNHYIVRNNKTAPNV